MYGMLRVMFNWLGFHELRQILLSSQDVLFTRRFLSHWALCPVSSKEEASDELRRQDDRV